MSVAPLGTLETLFRKSFCMAEQLLKWSFFFSVRHPVQKCYRVTVFFSLLLTPMALEMDQKNTRSLVTLVGSMLLQLLASRLAVEL